ncbi:hypothetical protein [Escherichia coli]|nr:hypothetical protein [Escherichia coli]
MAANDGSASSDRPVWGRQFDTWSDCCGSKAGIRERLPPTLCGHSTRS